MADYPIRTPERPIRAQTPGAPKMPRTPCPQVAVEHDPYSETPTPDPRAEPQQGLSSSMGFGPPLPLVDPSLSSQSDQQRSTCPRDGCYETSLDTHEVVSDPSSPQQLFIGYDEFRDFLESTNEKNARGTRPAPEYHDVALLELFDHENAQNLPSAPNAQHVEIPDNEDGYPLEALSEYLQEFNKREQENHGQQGMQDSIKGPYLGVFPVDMPFPEPEQPGPHSRHIMCTGPARPDRCISPTCPIHEAHGVGLYVHNSEWGIWPNEIFGISNPPDFIWAADARRLANRASPEDIEMVRQFLIHHDRPYPGA